MIWICLIVFLSLYSGDDLPHPSWLMFPQIDKAAHFFMYFVFAALLIHDAQHYGKIHLKYSRIILISVSVVVGWGGILEILQGIPCIHRSRDFFDFLANAAGAVTAAASYRIWKPLLNKIDEMIKS